MRWWRANSDRVAWIALLALLLQLSLSFGHVHLAPADHDDRAMVATATGGGNATPQPSGDEEHDDYCAICAILSLLTGAQTADAPAVSIPAVHIVAVFSHEADALRLITRSASFRSRAPPLS